MLRTPQVARREAPAGALPAGSPPGALRGGSPRGALPAGSPQSSRCAGAAGRQLVGLLAAAYAVFYGSLCGIKFRHYLYTDFDLAIFSQAVDGLLRGTMHSSIRGMNWLGDHSSLNLFLVAPLYAIFRTPLTLLLLQSVVLALGAFPVHATARRVLGDGGPAVACAALYLLFPALGYTNLFEFHPEVLSTTPLLFLLDAVHAGRPRAAAGWAFLALLGKEDVALVVLAIGLVVLVRPGARRAALGVPLVALGVAFLAFTFGVLKPQLAGAEASYGDMYRQWGDGARGIALGLLRHPFGALRALVDTPGDAMDAASKRWFHVHLLLPLAFLPLVSPLELVPAIPVLGEHLLSWRTPQHQIGYQYTALLTPTYVFAAIVGLGRVRRWLARGVANDAARERAGAVLAGIALVASLASQVAFGPLRDGPGLGLPAPSERFWPKPEERVMAPVRDRMLRALPPRGTIVAGFPYLARLAGRDSVISAHHVFSGEYTFSREKFPVPTGVRAAIFDAIDSFYGDSADVRLRTFVGVNHLRPVEVCDNVLRFAADPRDTVEWVTLGVPAVSGSGSIVFDENLELVSGVADSTAVAGDAVTIRTTWRRVGEVDDVALTQFALLDPVGKLVTSPPHLLGDLLHPVAEWAESTGVRETDRLMLGAHLAPGAYRLAIRVGWENEDGSIRDAVPDSADRSAVVDLGWIAVRARAR